MAKTNIRMIINADDLGYSEAVNDATFELIDCGIITSSTIMANAPAFEDAVWLAKNYPHISFGVHLNITEFKPLTDDDRLKPVLNDDGTFRRNWRSIRMTHDTRDAIANEWIAQYTRVQDTGLSISHIDSHHLVHTSWLALSALRQLQKKLSIQRIRTVLNLTDEKITLRWRLGSIKRRIWQEIIQRSNPTRITDYFAPFDRINYLFEQNRLPLNCTIEAMVHPDNPRYVDETELLRQGKNIRLLQEASLITFLDI